MGSNTVINTVFNNPLARTEMDFYPTPPEATEALLIFMRQIGMNIRTCHEPACGEGDMAKVIGNRGIKVYSSDILDRGFGVPGIDYLKASPAGCDAVITNPPFKLAEQFITKALSESDLVCMLLKSNYFHAASRLSLFRQTPPAFILPLTWRPNWFFKTKSSSSPTMDVSWYVWIKDKVDTQYIPISKPNPLNDVTERTDNKA